MSAADTATGPVDVEELRQQLAAAVGIAAEAGQLALAMRLQGVAAEEKGPRDLVSDADRASEDLITRRLAEVFPDDAVVGEEGAARDGRGRTWYVDPIDGTSNYVKGLPLWGVSLGLADADGRLLLGAIAMPAADEVYAAGRGLGATCNGVPIRCSAEDRLDRALVAHAVVGSAPDRWGGRDQLVAAAGALMRSTLGTRMQGCSVADLTGVAVGRLDACFAGGMSPWDVAAGLLIAQESGAVATQPDGTPVTGPSGAFLCSAPGVHDALRDLLAAHGAVPA